MDKNVSRSRASIVANFIDKTYQILHDPDLQHILKWSPAGTSFMIKDRDEFCREILPRYFKHSNFASFVRQLNMYNFHKVRGSKYENQFSHSLFLKDRRQLLIGIKRKPSEAEVEFGKQLIENTLLNTRVTSSNKSSEDFDNEYNKENCTERPSKCNIDLAKQNQTLTNQYKLLWQEYERLCEKNTKDTEKVIKFLASFINVQLRKTNLNNQSSEKPLINLVSISEFIKHLVSTEPAFEVQQYEQMLTKVNTQDVCQQPRQKIRHNIILKSSNSSCSSD